MRKALYDTFDYPKYWKGREYEDQAERIALRKFFAQIPVSSRNSLIDIGGGFGRLASLYLPFFKKGLLVDPSRGLLREAKKRLSGWSNVSFEEGDVEHIPTKAEEFDVALLVRVVHHLPDPYPTFLEAYRVLKPGGFFILEFANKIHFRACLRAWRKTDFEFSRSFKPVDQSTNGDEEAKVPFFNHHPELIKQKLVKADFKIVDCLSVSNFRSPLLKRLFPLSFLLALETSCQKFLRFCHFGPSIFVLCQKNLH